MALTQELTQELSTDQRQLLEARLSTLQDLQLDHKLLGEAIDSEKAEMLKELKAAGVPKAVIDGYTLSIKSRKTNTLNKQKFVSLGGNLDILAAAMESKTGKEFLDVRKAGQKSDDEEE